MPAPSPRRRLTAFAVAMAVLIATPLAVVGAEEFADVPSNNPHRNDIAWLADAAITLGCNPPANTNYCPDQPVRRDQMASFLRRLAENQVVHAATAVTAETAEDAENAAKLADEEPAAYRSLVTASLDPETGGGTVSSSLAETNSLEITVPSAGYLVVSGSIYTVNNEATASVVALYPVVDGQAAPGPGGSSIFDRLEPDEAGTLAYTTVFPVTAGTHTVVQSASIANGSIIPISGGFFWNSNNLVVEWHPEGSLSLALAGGGSGSQTGE